MVVNNSIETNNYIPHVSNIYTYTATNTAIETIIPNYTTSSNTLRNYRLDFRINSTGRVIVLDTSEDTERIFEDELIRVDEYQYNEKDWLDAMGIK